MARALSFTFACLIACAPQAGCGGDDTTSSPAPAQQDAGTDVQTDVSDDVSQEASAEDAAPDSPTEDASDAATSEDVVSDAPISPDAGLCLAVGGICVPTTLDCTDQGGTPHPEGDPDCVFDDGPARCCDPPTALPTGESCADRGGVCVPTPGACLKTNGIYAPFTADCSNYGQLALCCLPPSECSDEDLECCADTFTMRPYCDRGTWKCLDDSGTPVPTGTCG